VQKSGNPGRLKQSILALADVDDDDEAGVAGGELVGDDDGTVDGAGAGAGTGAEDDAGAGTGAGAGDEDAGAGAGAGAEDEAGAGAGTGAWHETVGLILSQLCRVCSQTFCLYESLKLARLGDSKLPSLLSRRRR